MAATARSEDPGSRSRHSITDPNDRCPVTKVERETETAAPRIMLGAVKRFAKSEPQ